MHTENTIKYEIPLNLGLFALGFAYFLFLHLYGLREVPGFHFDEAWAANNAWRIFQGEVGQSQSPYTQPWAAVLASLFYQFFGVNLFIFRLSQVACAILSLLLITRIFWIEKRWRLLAFFPWLLCFLPAIPMNHRFGIEMNAFHSFCFACLLTGLHRRYSRPEKSYEAYLWIMAGVLLGITSHILFLAPCLALLFAIFVSQKKMEKKDRLLLMLLSLVLLPFFMKITILLPSKGKGIALCCFCLIIFFIAYKGEGIDWKWLEKYRKKIIQGSFILSIPFLINLVFFSDGHWLFRITHGEILFRGFAGISMVLLLLVAWKMKTSFADTEKFFLTWLLYTTIFAGLMMLKPAPRYFHIAMWMLAIVLAFALSKLEFKKSAVALVLLWGINYFIMTTNYFLPAFAGLTKEESIKFLLYKDSSRDFLSKQRLITFLEARFCNKTDIHVEDARVDEAMQFLAIGDWKKQSGICYKQNLHIARKADHKVPPSSDAELVDDFYLWSK